MIQSFRKPCVVANWKMQGSLQMLSALIGDLLQGSQTVEFNKMDVVLCPPFPYLQAVEKRIQSGPFRLGAQNAYCEYKGAFTGEVSPEMLVDVGCSYVIIGHSERRELFFETDALIARKFLAAYHVGLTPILCVGETLAEREHGKTFEVVQRQLAAVLTIASLSTLAGALIAYEPVWAIGTGLTATPEQAEAVHEYIRGWLAKQDAQIASQVRILYGGSVNAANASGLFAMPNIDGGLIGGASLKAQEFLSICQSVSVPTV